MTQYAMQIDNVPPGYVKEEYDFTIEEILGRLTSILQEVIEQNEIVSITITTGISREMNLKIAKHQDIEPPK